MADYRLFCLGNPRLELGGKPIKLEMRKSLALLIYLRMADHNYSRESLAALFWPEYDQQHAQANLRRVLSSLNKSISGEFIEADREKICLYDRSKFWLDVDEFLNILSITKNHPHADGQSCSECLHHLEEAVPLYQGDFLEGFNLADSPEFDEWQFFHRENLRAGYGRTLEKMARAYQETREWEIAIRHARLWLALDRLHEPAQRMLMSLYFLSGQKSAALRLYEECQRVLEQELSQQPELETLQLFEEIRKAAPPEARQARSSATNKAPEDVSGNLLTKTKFFLPKEPRTIIHRQRLVLRLNQSVKKGMTLISASAGFGKTTLLAEWAAQSRDKIAWFSLDRDDNDVYRMVEAVVNAIRNVLPGSKAGTTALSLLHASQPVPISVIVGSLINDLVSIPNPLVLVLDDYHNIESSAVHDAIIFLLDHQPENLRLLISTRSDPPLPLARFRVNDQLSDIRTDDLRFTSNETQSFLTQVIGVPLSNRDLVFFEDKVEGWIVGIQMASLVMQSNTLSRSSSELHNFIHAFNGSQRYILDYLIEEVLNRQPDEIRSFLMRTSILEKLCFQLCDSLLAPDRLDESQQIDKHELTERTSSQQILESLERSNLFLIPLDDEQKWFRYHHLFADLLHVRLKQYEPRLESVLHKRAANWFAQNSYSMDAVKHALASSDYSFAADLIEEYSLRLIWMNQIATAFEWFKLLPPGLVASRPLLMIYQAFTLARRGEFERVEAILANAEASIKTMPASQKINDYKILIFGMRAFMANLRGEPEKAIQYILDISLTAGQQQDTASYAMARAQLAVAYLDSGDFSSAERVFTEIVQWAQEHQDLYYAILTNKELAEIWNIRGCPSQAEQLYKKMDDWLQQTVQEPGLYNGLIEVYQASLLIEKNELETARLLIQEDIESLLSVWRSSSLYIGYMVTAYLYTALGDFQQAKTAVEKALQWVTSQSLYPRNRSMVQACQVNLWLAQGNLAEAQNWAKSNFPQMPTELPYIRELDHLCLARVLVASRQWEAALDLLQRLSIEAEAGKRLGRLLKINILRALTLDGLSRFEESLDLLDSCLNYAYPEGYQRVFLDEGSPMKALLQRGVKERGWQVSINKDYVFELLEAFEPGYETLRTAQTAD